MNAMWNVTQRSDIGAGRCGWQQSRECGNGSPGMIIMSMDGGPGDVVEFDDQHDGGYLFIGM